MCVVFLFPPSSASASPPPSPPAAAATTSPAPTPAPTASREPEPAASSQSSTAPDSGLIEADFALGAARAGAKDRFGAFRAYRAAADEARRARDSAAEARSWLAIAALDESAFDWRAAVDAASEAVAAARAPGGLSVLGPALAALGSDYLAAGDTRRALETSLQASPLLHDDAAASNLVTVGSEYCTLGQYANAQDQLTAALATDAGGAAERAGALVVESRVRAGLDALPAAERDARESLTRFRALRDPAGEARALDQIGLVLASEGDRQRSAAAFAESLGVERSAGSAFAEASTLNDQGDVSRDFGDFDAAERLYRQALAIERELGDRRREAATLVEIGIVQDGRGDEAAAFVTLRAALDMQREFDDPAAEATALAATARVRSDAGDPQAALDLLRRGLALVERTDDVGAKVRLLTELANTNASLGDDDAAETAAKEARDLQRTYAPAAPSAATALASIELREALSPGRSADFKAEHLAAADGDYESALDSLQNASATLGQTLVLAGRAAIASEQGRTSDALATLERGRALATASNDAAGLATIEQTAGSAYARTEDWTAAIAHYRLALPLWIKSRRSDGRCRTLYRLAQAERNSGDAEAALRDVQLALAIAAGTRGSLADDLGALEVELTMRLAAEQPGLGYEWRALEASERARGRSLLALLAQAHVSLHANVDEALVRSRTALERSLEAKEVQLAKLSLAAPNADATQQLAVDIAGLRSQLETAEAKLRAANPASAALTNAEPVGREALQRDVLDSDTVLLDYWLGSERGYLWAITRERVDTYPLPPRGEIEEAARRFQTQIRNRAETAALEADPSAAYLSRVLLAPAVQALRYRIVVVPDGVLSSAVPFAALPAPGAGTEPLILHHEVVTEPSATAIAAVRDAAAQRTLPSKLLAVVADPVYGRTDERLERATPSSAAGATFSPELERLTSSAAEASAILPLGRPPDELALLGFDASKDGLLQAKLADYKIVHLAVRGIVDAVRPAASYLALSFYDRFGQARDGVLTLDDIYNLRVPANLVVLDACGPAGDGTLALTRGFLFAGATSIVASSWNVDGARTGELMRGFYQNLLARDGGHPGAALRAAQLPLLASSPYYWAAFSVAGDWY
jgi:CHAT domain-containing protein